MVIDYAMLLGLGLGAALELLITNQPRTEVPDTIQTSYNTIIKPVTLDGFGRPHLKFVLGDTPTLLMMDSVAGDSRLYWQKDDEIHFGTIEDLQISFF